MDWKSFVILYEESEGLVRLQEVLKLSSVYNDLQISVRQLIPSQPGDDYRYSTLGVQVRNMKMVFNISTLGVE